MKQVMYRNLFVMPLSVYLSDSFWGKPLQTARENAPISDALWAVRGRCQNADRLLASTIMAFADDKTGNYPATPDEYFLDRMALADRTVNAVDATQLPCIKRTLEDFKVLKN